MPTNHHSLYLGYHGCEKSLAIDLVLGKVPMASSVNSYDWLGSGMYFWEGDAQRAFEFARNTKKCKDPFVIGAVLNLGYCFDLTQRTDIDLLRSVWVNVIQPNIAEDNPIINKASRRGENGELMLRYLDCYVINTLHDFYKSNDIRPFDSVRAAFWEGEEVYPTAGFREKSHIQLCICNPDCILGLFIPKGFSI